MTTRDIPRLSARTPLADGVRGPAYDRAALRTGIVHIGPGAFHRAHQCAVTEAALEAEFGPWGIEALSLRSTRAADALGPQDGLYTLIEQRPDGPSARVIGALRAVHALSRTPAAAGLLASPATRIVTLTVTEKAYAPEAPSPVAALLLDALAARRTGAAGPLTLMACDNLPDNGAALRRLLEAEAARRGDDPALIDLARFPGTMVDRITPAPDADTGALATRLTGLRDEAAVATEPFLDWVIEDAFAAGRPAWEAGGARIVADVRPFEAMKLRMLNGAHSVIAWTGVLAGLPTVADAIAEPAVARAVEAHMAAAARTLPAGLETARYGRALRDRFANPAIRHATAQIAADSSAKLGPRILMPAAEAAASGQPLDRFALACALWIAMRAACAAGQVVAPPDPLADRLDAALAGADTRAMTEAASRAVAAPIWAHAPFRDAVSAHLRTILSRGALAALGEAHKS